MDHDHHPKHKDKNCNGKGIMSYGSPPLKWSTCSKSDWETEYLRSNWGNGCLEDIGIVSYQNILRVILEIFLVLLLLILFSFCFYMFSLLYCFYIILLCRIRCLRMGQLWSMVHLFFYVW